MVEPCAACGIEFVSLEHQERHGGLACLGLQLSRAKARILELETAVTVVEGQRDEAWRQIREFESFVDVVRPVARAAIKYEARTLGFDEVCTTVRSLSSEVRKALCGDEDQEDDHA